MGKHKIIAITNIINIKKYIFYIAIFSINTTRTLVYFEKKKTGKKQSTYDIVIESKENCFSKVPAEDKM